jgi:hypothetical protein
MWEVMILGSMVGWGALGHERVLENGSQPDFDLSINNQLNPVHLIGDITTISDRGLHKSNPIDVFRLEVEKLAKRYKVDPDHFQVYVTGSHVGKYGDSRVRLTVPLGSAQRHLLHNRIEPFVRGIARAKGRYPLSLTHTEGGVGILTVSYDPRRRFFGGGHLSYSVAYSRAWDSEDSIQFISR